MPVVISLLNSFTGLAAALTGFALGNDVLIISGALVGASGTLLTLMMGKAMNRSVANVLFGAFGSVKTSEGGGSSLAADAVVRESSVDDVANMLADAQHVIVVPGYGMAVAQAQHSVRELADELERRGVDVKYAIHPVAGRMPGHMNVLLAEANVPYPALIDMEDINPRIPAGRCRARDRRERRHESRRAIEHEQPDLRHADSRRRQGRPRGRPQTFDEAGLRGHR